MSKKRKVPGICIQAPISRMILDGSKTIETRFYPISSKYIGKQLALIETPGRKRNFRSRVIGLITFGRCFEYGNEKQFYSDTPKHKVTSRSQWSWKSGRKKWGWEITEVTALVEPIELAKRPGVIYTSEVTV